MVLLHNFFTIFIALTVPIKASPLHHQHHHTALHERNVDLLDSNSSNYNPYNDLHDRQAPKSPPRRSPMHLFWSPDGRLVLTAGAAFVPAIEHVMVEQGLGHVLGQSLLSSFQNWDPFMTNVPISHAALNLIWQGAYQLFMNAPIDNAGGLDFGFHIATGLNANDFDIFRLLIEAWLKSRKVDLKIEQVANGFAGGLQLWDPPQRLAKRQGNGHTCALTANVFNFEFISIAEVHDWSKAQISEACFKKAPENLPS